MRTQPKWFVVRFGKYLGTDSILQEDVAPTLSRQPLSFDELNTALAGAHEEVRSLRQQYDELQALVSKRLGTEIRDQVKPLNNGRVDTRNAGSQVRPGAPSSDVPTEIANLSENEVKRAFSVSGLGSRVIGG